MMVFTMIPEGRALIWFLGLSIDDKLKVIHRFNELVVEQGMILVGGHGTLKPDHELPHGPENNLKRRKREKNEKKIAKRCEKASIMEMYKKHLKGEF